jgi:cell filamentation protein
MSQRYADNDHYTYPDSSVLVNKLGIRNADELKRTELVFGVIRSTQPAPEGNFDTAHLLALHRHLFQDVYTWAGTIRDVHISLGNSPFCAPQFIERSLATQLGALANEGCLAETDPDTFAERAAFHLSELNAIHPFREGNGRTIRLFLFLLAENAGYDLNSDILEGGWLVASIAGFTGNNEPMKELLLQAMEQLEP